MTLEEFRKIEKESEERNKEAQKLLREAKRLKKESKVQNEEPKEQNEEVQKQGEKVDKLQDKVERILEDSPEEIRCSMLDNWKPYQIKDYVLPVFKIPVKKSNNYESSKVEMLSKILTFIDFAQRKRCKNGCTAMPIPTTSRQNLMIWGSEMAVSRAIKFMKEIGLITTFDESYRFGVPYEGGNYGKLYAYYEENERKLIQYCKDNNIHKYVVKNVEEIRTEKEIKRIETIIESIDKVKTFEISDVRFGKKLDLKKPEGFSKAAFEIYLTLCLYVNNEELIYHQMKADEINKRFYEPYPEFKLRFKPHFTWKGNKVVKIGIRLSNAYCCKEKEERKELLKQYGFHLAKDIKSSVPRLTLSINTGHWIDEGIDIYELINKEFDPGSEFTEERRDNIKRYVLPTYFDESSDKMLGKNVTYKLGKTGLNKKEVDELMGCLRAAMLKAVGGKTYGSDIFFIESCVYLMTLYDLLTSGHMAWLVYDAFYSNGEEDDDTFKFMVEKSVELNFGYFMEKSSYRQYSKGAGIDENQGAISEKSLSVKNIINKYNINTLVNE